MLDVARPSPIEIDTSIQACWFKETNRLRLTLKYVAGLCWAYSPFSQKEHCRSAHGLKTKHVRDSRVKITRTLNVGEETKSYS